MLQSTCHIVSTQSSLYLFLPIPLNEWPVPWCIHSPPFLLKDRKQFEVCLPHSTPFSFLHFLGAFHFQLLLPKLHGFYNQQDVPPLFFQNSAKFLCEFLIF